MHNVIKVFEKAIHQKLYEYHSEGYETVYNGLILLPQEDINAAAGIIQLYEKILKSKKIPPLLESLITLKITIRKHLFQFPTILTLMNSIWDRWDLISRSQYLREKFKYPFKH